MARQGFLTGERRRQMGDIERDKRDEERIRARAYALWEEEGRPAGREHVHWDKARELVAIEDSYLDTLQPRGTGAEPVAEPSVAIENQGEFPGVTDQGDSDKATSAGNSRRQRRR
jgi:hypothetical protein